jgi:tannase
MRSTLLAPAAALAYAAAASATSSLNDICTDAYAKAALPIDAIDGITIDTSSVSTSVVTNFTAESIFYPTSTFDYCNLTFAYSHNGLDGDKVHVQYWLPAPGKFNNRYVSTGGGGWAINSGSSSIPTAIIVDG